MTLLSSPITPRTVLAAEVVRHFLPRLVELHNYSPANSTSQKLDNWRTLNSEAITATACWRRKRSPPDPGMLEKNYFITSFTSHTILPLNTLQEKMQ